MNKKFFTLSQRKQMRIIEAGIDVFGEFGYQKANTDDIAAKAGISKGLLFYYFHNKKEFYLFLYDFFEKMILKMLPLEDIQDIDDFFDLLDYATKKKLMIVAKYPSLMNFIVKACYSQKDDISLEMNQKMQSTIEHVFQVYFQYIDMTRFKDEIDFKQIYHMLLWMAEGYLLEKQRLGQHWSVEDMLNEFEIWKNLFKKMCYKEEYL